MFRRGNELQVRRVIAFQRLAKGNSEAARQVRAFAERLVAAAPARIAEDVDVRAPERKTLVVTAVALAQKLVMLRARLIADRGRDLRHASHVPHRGKADGLRKHGGNTRSSDTVQALVPPIVR